MATLTARQMEILTCAARGLLDREIAGEIGLAAQTVGHHLQALRTNLRAQHLSYRGDRVRYTGRVKPTTHERSCEWKIAFGDDVNPKYGSRPHAKALLTTKSTNRLIGDLC